MSALEKMTIKEPKDFMFENYYRHYYSMKHQKKKDLLLLSTKIIEKVPDPSNAKEHYQSYSKKKNPKLVK